MPKTAIAYDERALVKSFDQTESRWDDEKAYEDFKDYQMFMKRMCSAAGAKMVKLEAEPFRMTFKGGDGVTKYMFVLGGAIIITEDKPDA